MATLAATIGRGTLAARPSTMPAGSLYYVTDTSTLYRSNGTTWDSIEAAAAAAYTDEQARDAIGTALTAGAGITITPSDPADTITIAATGFSDPLTTKGDLLTRSSSATVRQGVGTTGQVLTADASQANGIKWATPSGTDPPYPPSAYVKAMATTPVIIGALPFWNVTGTGASDDDTNGLWIKQTTGATSGNNSGAGSGSFAVVRRDWGAAGVWLSRFADVTNVRLWVGFFAASPTASDTPTVTMAAFRFSTAAADTTWRAITADGAGGLTNTDTGVALSAGDRPLMEVRLGTTTTFFIGGALVASHTTNLPGPTTTMGPVSWITTLTAAAKTSAVGYMQVWPRGR